MEKVTIELTREEAEELSSLLTSMTGKLQDRAVRQPDGSLDNSWRFWNTISRKVSSAFGFEAFMQPSKLVDDLTETV